MILLYCCCGCYIAMADNIAILLFIAGDIVTLLLLLMELLYWSCYIAVADDIIIAVADAILLLLMILLYCCLLLIVFMVIAVLAYHVCLLGLLGISLQYKPPDPSKVIKDELSWRELWVTDRVEHRGNKSQDHNLLKIISNTIEKRL